MDLKTNINKIHSDLLLLEGIGETVTIKECTDKRFGNFFEISASDKGMTARIVIEKTSIENQNFVWMYYANPNDIATGLVERQSSTDSFTVDLIDVFNKKRFDSDYLSQINN